MLKRKTTIAEAKRIVCEMGLILKWDSNIREFCVKVPGNPNADCYTDHVEDAINTARAMASSRLQASTQSEAF